MNGRNTGMSRAVGWPAPALGPVEQFGKRRLEPVPHFLDRLDVERESVGERLLGEPGGDADAERTGGELQERESARTVEMVEHPGQHPRRLQLAGQAQPLDRVAQPDRAVVEVGRFALGHRPEERDGLGAVADIVAAHAQQHGVDALLGQRTDRGRLHIRDVERAGERGEREAAVGIGRFLEVIADQPELGQPRARVDEVVEELGESAHRALNARGALWLTNQPLFVIGTRERAADFRRLMFFSLSGFSAMAKPATVKIKLVSSADTGFFYVTKKNPRTQTEKMSFRKYDPVVRKHVDFKEAKIK